MVLRLRLATGKIKEYRTSYSHSGEGSTYHTKCGTFWADCPKREDECDHLDCAIDAAERETFGAFLFLAFTLLVVVASGGLSQVGAIFKSGWYILAAAIGALIWLLMVYALYRSNMDKNELNEFANKGTIAGVMAWKEEGSK